jgi:hypothetical protein
MKRHVAFFTSTIRREEGWQWDRLKIIGKEGDGEII